MKNYRVSNCIGQARAENRPDDSERIVRKGSIKHSGLAALDRLLLALARLLSDERLNHVAAEFGELNFAKSREDVSLSGSDVAVVGLRGLVRLDGLLKPPLHVKLKGLVVTRVLDPHLAFGNRQPVVRVGICFLLEELA